MKKPTTRHGQIDLILSQLSHTELQAFVREKALQDEDFRATLLICFADLLSSDESCEPKYQQVIHDMIQRHATTEGFIYAESAIALATSLQHLLASARKATTPPREATDLCLAVISALPVLADKMDDAEGYVYELMRIAVTTLWECSSSLTADRQQALFERVLTEYAKPVYLDLDLDSALLSLLKDWSKNNPVRQAACLRQLESVLKTTHGDKWRKNYLLEQTNSLLMHWKG